MDHTSKPQRAQHEVMHGKKLAAENPELVWGWGSPAGQLRAKRRAELIALNAELSPDTYALEIGCGTGLFTKMFAQHGSKLLAVDISTELLTAAEMRNLPKNQVRFLAKRFEDCAVDGPYDAVIGSSVLHHLDLEVALTKMFALLKPGGILSFAEPNMLNPQVFAERNLRFLPMFWYVSPDETAFIRWSLANLLLKIGFRDIAITPFDWLHPAIPSSMISGVQHVGRWLEKTPILREFSGSLIIRASRPNSV